MAINIDKIDKVDTNLITPSTEGNLVEFERDGWGIILNTTLNVINKNNIIFKEIILELINNINSINLSDIKLKLKNLEIDVNSLEGIVDNNNLEYINIGLENRKLNLKGTQLELNNNEINLDDIAFKSKNNTFKKAVNTEEHFSIEGEKIIDIENSYVNVGNPKNLINLISSEDIILLNGVEFKQKPIDVATETKAGIITEARIKEIAPKPDLTPYVPFSKGFRNQNSTDWFVRTTGRVTWVSDSLEMYNGDNNQFMGAFHTNGLRAYYKVPNRNGGNWNEIMDNHDLNNLNTTVNQIVGSYVRDLRMSGYVVGIIHHHNIGIERNGYVVTGVVQNTNDNIVDLIQMRALQMNRGGNWYNVPFE